MKRLVLTLAALAFAQSGFAETLEGRLSKITQSIEKDGRSVFCVVSVPEGRFKAMPSVWPTTSVCVGDVSFNAGTINERNGCAAFILNLSTLQTSPLISHLDYNLIENKKCSDGGFTALMDSELYTDNTAGLDKPGRKVPVGSAFSSAYRLPDKDFGVAVAFSSRTSSERLMGRQSQYENWFSKARAEYLERLKKKGN